MAKTHLDWLELTNYSSNPTDVDSTKRGIAIVNNAFQIWDGTAWGGVEASEIAAEAVRQSELAYETADVTVSAAATSGTATVTNGSIILGYYPTGNQDQLVDNISVSGTTLTITLAAAATADNTFRVVLLKV